MIEFLLSGGKDLNTFWPKAACNADVLLCNKNHSGLCSPKFGCGVGNATIRFNIIPAIGVDGFDCSKFDIVFVLALSKKNLNAESSLAKLAIQPFLINLQRHGISVFESQSLTGTRVWENFMHAGP